jgi:hypothetical protein
LSAEEEEIIVERLMLLGEWGFPLTTHDLKQVIKAYLDACGRTTRFADNLPGKDFAAGFLRRHKELTVRTANLIKRSRAMLSADIVNDFFDKYEVSAVDVPDDNVYNYDETNLRDNPGAVKAIFRKGVKYAEQVRDHSKSSISMMMCGNRKGFLPPYILYKGGNVYESWCMGGPDKAVYSSSQSGWFDMFVFEDWFKKIFLPHVRRQPGKKILLGDNLASHISLDVIQLCRENDIKFICLPPNSTDKMQPLDVGIFGPMKNAWRKQLKAYADQDPAAKLLKKTEFPRMVKELLQSLNPGEHLPKAFEKCGLVPVNRQKVLERLPSTAESHGIARNLDSVLLKRLEVRRFGDGTKKKPRGKKVPAGQSYSAETEEEDEEEVDDIDSESEEVNIALEDSEEEEEEELSQEEEADESLPDLEAPGTSRMGSYVVAAYEGQWFIAEVSRDQEGVAKGYTRLSYMLIKGKNSFSWGDKPDIHVALNEDILLEHVMPEPVNNRGHLGLKKTDLQIILSRMVVVYFLHQIFLLIFWIIQCPKKSTKRCTISKSIGEAANPTSLTQKLSR